MTRVFLPAAKVSQMDNPQQGTGQGGDRCTEAVASMIDLTYKIGPSAQTANPDGEKIMYDFVAWLNNGATVSKLENPDWIAAWVAQHSNDTIHLIKSGSATFADCKAVVDRGHIAVLQVQDYSQLRSFDGGNPYQWPETQHAGHVVLLVGYDDDYNGHGPTLILHDPLRALGGMPWDYAWAYVKAAGPDTLYEVNGPPLGMPPPDPLQALEAQLQAALASLADYKAKLAKDESTLQSVKTWLSAMPNF